MRKVVPCIARTHLVVLPQPEVLGQGQSELYEWFTDAMGNRHDRVREIAATWVRDVERRRYVFVPYARA